MIAQIVRAVLFAMATVATRTGFRASRLANRGSIVWGLCFARHGGHADNEELAQVLVAHLCDTPKPLFAATRLLKRRQSQPGGELSPRAELMRVGDRCGKCRRSDRPHAGDRHKTPRDIVTTLPDEQIAIDLTKSDMDIEHLL